MSLKRHQLLGMSGFHQRRHDFRVTTKTTEHMGTKPEDLRTIRKDNNLRAYRWKKKFLLRTVSPNEEIVDGYSPHVVSIGSSSIRAFSALETLAVSEDKSLCLRLLHRGFSIQKGVYPE